MSIENAVSVAIEQGWGAEIYCGCGYEFPCDESMETCANKSVTFSLAAKENRQGDSEWSGVWIRLFYETRRGFEFEEIRCHAPDNVAILHGSERIILVSPEEMLRALRSMTLIVAAFIEETS